MKVKGDKEYDCSGFLGRIRINIFFSSEIHKMESSVSRSRSRSSASRDRDRSRKRSRSRSRSYDRSELRNDGIGHSRRRESDSSSDSSGEEDRYSKERKDRSKKLKRVDLSNPLSMYQRQTSHRKNHIEPTPFVRKEWYKLRGLNDEGKYVVEDDTKVGSWKSVILADKLVKKYGGEIFADTKLDDGLHSIVESNDSSEDKELTKLQKLQGSTAHLALRSMEGFVTTYEKVQTFINYWIGRPCKPNPEFDQEQEESESNQKHLWSEQQEQMYDQGKNLLREFQVVVAEPIANISRISTAAFTNTLSKRRERVLNKIKKGNPSAATAITRIAPSVSHMFGGDHKKLENVVKLNKDLITSGKDAGNSRKRNKYGSGGSYQSHSSDYHGHGHGSGRGGGKGRGGYSYGGGHSYDKRDRADRKFGGGNSSRGRKGGK